MCSKVYASSNSSFKLFTRSWSSLSSICLKIPCSVLSLPAISLRAPNSSSSESCIISSEQEHNAGGNDSCSVLRKKEKRTVCEK